MRKFLLALTALASILGAGAASYVGAVTVSYLGAASGCNEANQLMNCINSSVIGLLNGQGQTKPISVGLWGTTSAASGNNATLNTQGGVVTWTGVNLTTATNVSQTLLNSFVTTASACQAWLMTEPANAVGNVAPYIRSVVPTAGTLTIMMDNPGAGGTNATNFAVGFWCAN